MRANGGLSSVVACWKTEQVTFLIVAYACCINHTAWFLKHEALRLMTKVKGLTVPEKVMLLRLLKVEVHLDGAMHCVNFENATRLVAARSVPVRNGYVYVQDAQLASVIREAYDLCLMAFLKKCKTRLEEIARTNTQYYAPQYGAVLSVMQEVQLYVSPVVSREFVGLECTAFSLPQRVAQFAPLCIVKLVHKLRVQRHLIDKERVTLRLWLRAVKVKLDVAVEFWSQHVKDKEDVRGPIAQAYGKNYACVGCAKIRAQGLCVFQDSDKTMLMWCKDTVPSILPDMEDILKQTPCPVDRCGRVFALRHGGKLGGPRNPANYFARASEAGLPRSSTTAAQGLGLL